MSSDNTQQPHEKKWPHLKDQILHLIYADDEFIVFLDKKLDIDWETSEVYDDDDADENKNNEIINRAARIECIPNNHQQDGVRLNFKRMVAEGIARSLDHDYVNASKMLDDAENYIKSRNIEIARYWQLYTSLALGVILVVIGLFVWLSKNDLLEALGHTVFFSGLASCAGGIGASVSIISRIGGAEITSEAEKRLHGLEAVSRIFAGVVSGLIISLLILLGLVVPVFQSTDNTYVAMMAGGLLAGVSERFVPSLVEKLEKS